MPLGTALAYDPRQFGRADAVLRNLPPAFRARARVNLKDELEGGVRYMQRTYLSGTRTTRTSLARRTGALRRSWRTSVRVTPYSIEGRIFQARSERGLLGARPVTYAPPQEFGAVIRPVRAKLLKVPLTETARRTPGRLRGLFVLKVNDKLFLVRRVGDGLSFEFILKDHVVIPARPFFRPTMRWLRPRVRRRMRLTMAEAMLMARLLAQRS